MKNANRTFGIVIVLALLILAGVIFAVSRGSSSSASGSNASVTELKDMNSLLNHPAPDFTLVDKNGTTQRLSGLRGKTVILFFNEGLMCYPACWNQMAQLSLDPRLNTEAVRSYSVVVDSAANWGPAIAQMPDLAKAEVLYDPDSAVSKEYGMLRAASSMHYGIFPGHTYVVIDPAGIVRYILDDPRMAINNDKLAIEIESLKTGVTNQ